MIPPLAAIACACIYLLERGHIYLQRYKVIAVGIIFFIGYEAHRLGSWYMDNAGTLQEWQNAPILGLVAGNMAALKFALEHVLRPVPGDQGDDT